MDDDVLVGDGVAERTPTPPIRVGSYDGQELLARLLRRWQAADGTWYYEVTLTFWAHATIQGIDLAEPADIAFSVPASHVTPVPDTCYKGVPIRRHPAVIARARSGRKTAPNPPPPAEAGSGAGAGRPQVRGDATDRWKVQRPRHPYNDPGPRRTVIHHETCFTTPDPAELTTAQALAALRRPGAEACTVCGADQLTAR
ncbi:DUF6233 domain-containing protein [Streptomyces cinnamoneus]|uniref:Uncharacterized protein n=1 Tax=Streptomyces cinnamoneus TaxID=53446 RepID=A0A918TST4_STRCJ|nr:DUF6233 domain-containing protein [Streptomyces cinnamoneus]GHC57558.1 hypothetical protein GCM10010507_37770 [Streptomyces cinnamoneus]